MRAEVAAFTAMVEVRARVAAMELRTGVRVVERERNAVVFAAVLDAVVLDLTGRCATVLDEVVLWAAAFDAAAFDLPAFAAVDVLGDAGFACEKATRCSGTLNIASARKAVIDRLRW